MTTPGSSCLRDLWCHNRDPSWNALDEEFDKSYLQELDEFLHSQASGPGICPPRQDIFKAFELTQLSAVRVVIVGHDPYTDGRATGLAFAVPNDRRTNGSLNTISLEILTDTGRERVATNELIEWAEQGVLLLNCALTARPGASRAFSHGERRWKGFTDRAIEVVDEQSDRKVVFCLWGLGKPQVRQVSSTASVTTCCRRPVIRLRAPTLPFPSPAVDTSRR